jgi:hypothetical protein
MRMQIIVLEDNLERQAAMRDCLGDRFSQYELRFFDEPAEFIAFARQNLDRLLAIALDHDIELKPDGSGGWRDPGTGQDVVEFLITQQPICGIVLHSSNQPAMISMQAALREAGWMTESVSPYGDTTWIREAWFPAVRRIVVHGPRVRPVHAVHEPT